MGLALLQEETRINEENLRYLAESNWTTFFSHISTFLTGNIPIFDTLIETRLLSLLRAGTRYSLFYN